MLLGLQVGERPLYVAKVDGVAGPETHSALALFQACNELEVNGLADDPTLDALILAYLDLLGAGLEPDRVFAAGAGSEHPIVSFGPEQAVIEGDGSAQRLRRVEFFVTDGRMSPPAATLADSPNSYQQWCSQVRADASLPFVFDTHVTVVDGFLRPLKGELITVFENQISSDNDSNDGGGDDFAGNRLGSVAEGVTDNAGVLSIQVPRGHYELLCPSRDRVLRAALAVDPDEHGAQRVTFMPKPTNLIAEGLIVATTAAERGDA